jgi:hypothetical protein
MSRYQCTINYLNGAWVLSDGYGDKESTNGTWLFANTAQQMVNGQVFKAAQAIFKVNISH